MAQVANPFQTTRSFRRKGHQPQPAAFQQLIKQPPIGLFDRRPGMRSLSLWRKERSFQMESQRLRSQHVTCGQECFERREGGLVRGRRR
jgi:hypothetical protein